MQAKNKRTDSASVSKSNKPKNFRGQKLYLTNEEFQEYKSLIFPKITPEAIFEKEQDRTHTDYTVTESDKHEGGILIKAGSTCFFVQTNKKTSRVEIPVGAQIRLYGGFGQPVDGVELLFPTSFLFYYRTKQQASRLHQLWCLSYENENKERYRRELPDIEEKISVLTEPFKARMLRLRNSSPDGRHQWEPYEIFILSQADEFLRVLNTVEKIDEFHDANRETQKKMVPALDDGHSGNTFHCSCSLARRVALGETI